MKFARIFCIAFFVTISMFVTSPEAYAEGGIVPCGTTAHPEVCTLCHILIGGKGIIEWGMGIMVIVGLALIMIAGVIYIVSVGDTGLMGKAKTAIQTVLIGFMLILCGWLIINTIIGVLANDSMGIGIQKSNWYTFTCDKRSSANTSGSTTNGNGSGADCTDAGASGMKERVNASGGKMCGTSYSCSTCDTSKWTGLIEQYRGGIPRRLVDAVIAKESSCRENPGAMDGLSCGLMQVKFANVNQSNCTTPNNLNDPETNIREGMKILKSAWDTSASYDYTAIGIKREEIAYVIYNSGTKDVANSGDCTSANGWPAKFPRYACPINPGNTPYNACFIRQQACKVGACF